LLAAPGSAAADVIFDPADADELAAVLAEAYTDQNVCYGWHVSVDNAGSRSDSVGSNFGAGKPVDSGSCSATVEFSATITYTSESSESEDSASFDVRSSPPGVSRDDLIALDLDFDGLTGEDPDAVVGKAVTALPLLAADKGIADPISAAPETGTTPADAQLTDDPGSDWWRDRGGMLLWALALLAASGVLIVVVLKMSPRRRPGYVHDEPQEDESGDVVPLYVSDIVGEQADPDLDPATKRQPSAEPAPDKGGEVEEPAEPSAADEDRAESPVVDDEPAEQPTAATEPAEDSAESPASESPAEKSTTDDKPDSGPSDLKDKE
jgi:hypothetical protein